ncbi:unnamed protein product [Caenorhabditis sp. 36 PRJEB53466]|nr:unnamed protein product [Caenorhabditis sp. 36 PRJEB53466]
MKSLVILSVLCLIGGAHADCACYEASNYTGKSAPISNSYNTEDFSACYKQCSYVAYSGDDTYGWTGLTFRWGTTAGSGGLVEIFDGPAAIGTPIIQINEGEDVDSGSSKSSIKSSSSSITIKYSQTGTGANVYYGVIKAVPGLQPSAAPTTTTSAPTTRSSFPAGFTRDPYLISHDILVVINQKTSGGIKTMTNIIGFVTNFVNILSTTTDVNSISSSRLSLATLTPYSPYFAVQGGIWELNATSLTQSLRSSGITLDGSIDEALIGLIELAFNVNTNSSTDSRPNAQRSIVLFTGEWPSTGALLNETYVKPIFDKYGVNLLVAGYNLTDLESSQVLRPNRWYNAFTTVATNNAGVANFVNPFYFNNGSETNYWCPQTGIESVANDSGASFSFFSEPFNYIGPDGSSAGKLDWSALPAYNGENARYCNFANNQYVYTKPANAPSMKVSVYYELEAGKDTLSFYDSSNTLIASFTGYDISEASFYTSTDVLTARFTSDNQALYRGFYVKITPQPSS